MLRATAREHLRTFRVATWLGWQIEGNWTDPFAFFVFIVLRPLATALMVVVMYAVVAGGQRGAFFSYLYLSNALFVLVVQTMSGMAWAIFDDREEYRMLKYIYTAPGSKFVYLLGRAAAKVLIGILGTLILLGVGVAFLGLPLRLEQVAWGPLAVTFVLGMVILAGLGLVLGGLALLMARHSMLVGEVSAGVLLLFSGAYFPPDTLPPGLREITLALPVTYWLEGMRRALAGGILQATVTNADGTQVTGPISPILAQIGDGPLLLILLVSALASAAGSFWFYHWVEWRAKEGGRIDMTSEY